jgi:ATP-dependent Clp protease ATP-binding subunit ClpC
VLKSQVLVLRLKRGLRSKFEQHHTLSYHDKALEQAAILADKYVSDRFLPDKAIDVLDEAGARVRLENRRLPLGLRSLMHELQETIKDKEDCIKNMILKLLNSYHEMEVRTHIRIMKQSALTSEARGFSRRDVDMVTETDVSDVVSNGLVFLLQELSESARLLKMEDSILNVLVKDTRLYQFQKRLEEHEWVYEIQSTNCKFYIRWTNWCWKNRINKALSEYMFGTEESMIRLDMSEYGETYSS